MPSAIPCCHSSIRSASTHRSVSGLVQSTIVLSKKKRVLFCLVFDNEIQIFLFVSNFFFYRPPVVSNERNDDDCMQLLGRVDCDESDLCKFSYSAPSLLYEDQFVDVGFQKQFMRKFDLRLLLFIVK